MLVDKNFIFLCLSNAFLAAATSSPSAAPSATPSITPTVTPTASPSYSQSPSIRPSLHPTMSPTATPTTYFAPTPLPSSVDFYPVDLDPIAQHQLIVVNPGSYVVFPFKFYDPETSLFTYTVVSTPTSGTLSQLSQVYSKYGYEPKNGEKIISVPTNVTGSQNRVYYARPTPDYAGVNKWDTFQFIITRMKGNGISSQPGTVTLVPPGGQIVGSNFLLSNEQWSISGNKQASTPAVFEPYSRGSLMNYYIMGQDDLVNVAAAEAPDTSLWYFDAPASYYGNQGIAYGGTLSFSIAAFAGDFTKLNDPKANVVILECATCKGPVRGGITLAYTLGAFMKGRNWPFDGSPRKVILSLTEKGGWLKDSQNSLLPWTTPSQCDVIQVLSRLSRIRILGDWTRWYETVAIDDVQIANSQAQLPICSMALPDASICTC